MKNEVLDFSFGSLFPLNMRFMGYAIMTGGAAALLYKNELLGFIILFIGGWMAFRRSGVQIDSTRKKYREYTAYMLKCGKWTSYNDYTDLAILEGKEGYTAHSRGMVELSVSDKVYDIYMLKPDHRSRIIVCRCKSLAIAKTEGEILAKKLGLKWTSYNPVVSAQTAAKRRRR